MSDSISKKEPPSGFELLCPPLKRHHDLINRLAWSPDGKILASSSSDCTIRLWDKETWETGKPIKTLEGHSSFVNDVDWSPDMGFLATGSDDKTIKLWDVETGTCLHSIKQRGRQVYSVAWSPAPDENILAFGYWDSAIRIWEWDGKDLTYLQTRREHKHGINSLAWSPKGKILASGSKDETIRIWEWNNNDLKSLQNLKGHKKGVNSVAWSPDGRILASGSGDGTIRLWNAETGELIETIGGHTALVKSISFSYDGRLLASKSLDGTVRIWHSDIWEILTVLDEPTAYSWLNCLAFHPKESILATLGEEDRIIRIWYLQIHAVIKALENPKYKLRTISDISKETSLEPQNVSEIVFQNTNIVVKSLSKTGEELYTTWQHFLASTSLSFWIFRAVPEQYDINKQLYEGFKGTWYATRYHNKMHPGDIVFFWLGGVPIKDRGIYAWGRLTSNSYIKDNWEAYGVDVIVERILPSPITVPEIKKVEILSRMLILRMDVGTNFLLSNEEVQALVSLCAKADPEWSTISLLKEQH